MGFWNKTTDGSLEIPMSNIAEAARTIDNEVLSQAVRELKTSERFGEVLNKSSAAAQLIEALSNLHLKQFERKVIRYQESQDPAEVERLRNEISRELFGCRMSDTYRFLTVAARELPVNTRTVSELRASASAVEALSNIRNSTPPV